MPDLPACRRDQLGVFTSTQARRSGLTRHQVQRLLVDRHLVTLRRGVYIERAGYLSMTANDQSLARAVAACLARPGSVISHHSAALVHDLPLVGSRPAEPALTIAIPGGVHGRRDRAGSLRAAWLPDWQVERRGAWAVTSPARTVCDLAREQPALSALVAIDAALSRGLTTRRAVLEVAIGCSWWPGGAALSGLLREADSGAESPYETVARLSCRELGLGPVPQVWAYDDNGPIGCGDLWLPQLWSFLEVDGDVKYTQAANPEILLDEKRRQERLQRAGFGVARVAAREARLTSVISARVEQVAAQARFGRLASRHVTGYVGPPPLWAHRGTEVELLRPPETGVVF